MKWRCPLLMPLLFGDDEFRAFTRTYRNGLLMMQPVRHHVWPGQRINVPSNLIDVNPLVHDWLHHRSVEGRVAGIWARTGQPGFSWDELDYAAGLNVRGWLEQDKCSGLMRPYCDMREELVG